MHAPAAAPAPHVYHLLYTYHRPRNTSYVTNIVSNSVVEIQPSGKMSKLHCGKLVNLPQGIACDGSDNLFVANSGDNTILKIAAGETEAKPYADTGDPQVR